MAAYVYRLVHRPTGKFYIGSTDLMDDRKVQHMESLRKGHHQNVRLQRFYNKKGPKGFEFEVHEVKNRKEAYALEQKLITKHLDNPKLMNIGKGSLGGDNLSRHPDRDKIIAKMTKAVQARWDNASDEDMQKVRDRVAGKNNPMYGKTHTKEARARISKANKGRPGYFLGKTFSDEHKAKLSEIAKDRTGEKNGMYGIHHSKETREHLRKKMLERGTNYETPQRKRISVDGVVYESLSAAKRELGIPAPTLSWRATNTKPAYANIFYLD